MKSLTVLIEDYAKVEGELRVAVSVEDVEPITLKEIEIRADSLEEEILNFKPQLPSELIEKMQFVRQRVLVVCENSPQIAAMFSALTRGLCSASV